MLTNATRIAIVYLRGEFGIADREALLSALEPAATADLAIVDVSNAPYVDSSVIGCLLSLRKNMNDRRGFSNIRLRGVRGAVAKLFDACRLDLVFATIPEDERIIASDAIVAEIVVESEKAISQIH